MCGLIGALLSRPTLTNERMAAALTTIVHRGPDNTAYWLSFDRRMALGHVRLSIIGLVNGDQPIVKTVVYGPYPSGSARHRQPSRNRWMIPLMTRRSFVRSGPVWAIGRCGSIAAHCSSLSQKLSATNQALLTSLNHDARLNSIGYGP